VTERTETGERIRRTRPSRSLLGHWRYAMSTANMPPGATDPVTKWLVLTRAAVQPMTITAAAIAGLLAVGRPGFEPLWFALAAVGLVLAHAANNLMNDLFDFQAGADTLDYPRALYAPHPVLSGLIGTAGLVVASGLINAVDLGILVVLFVERGWPVVAFALAGLFVSVAYTAPPFRLKKRALGEPAVLLVWGPLMVGGTYYAATGHLPLGAVVASFPYALLATSVLMGKHIDKIAWDREAGIVTLPVVMGERRARVLTQAMMAGFYVLVVALVAARVLEWPALLGLLGLTRLRPVWRVFSKPKPAQVPPEYPDYPVWPLWFAAAAFLHARRAGALSVVGLAIGAVFLS